VSADAEVCESIDDNVEWPDIHVLDLDCSLCSIPDVLAEVAIMIGSSTLALVDNNCRQRRFSRRSKANLASVGVKS